MYTIQMSAPVSETLDVFHNRISKTIINLDQNVLSARYRKTFMETIIFKTDVHKFWYLLVYILFQYGLREYFLY